MMVAAAATMIPASMLMQRFGRKAGFLLGVGWSFLFIGGIASLSAVGLLNAWGWQSVNLTVLPFLGMAALACS